MPPRTFSTAIHVLALPRETSLRPITPSSSLFRRSVISLHQANIDDAHRTWSLIDTIGIGMRSAHLFVCCIEEREQAVALVHQAKRCPDLGRPDALSFLDDEVLNLSPMDSIGRKRISHLIWLMVVIDGDISSIRQPAHDRVFNKPRFHLQGIQRRTALPGTTKIICLRQ